MKFIPAAVRHLKDADPVMRRLIERLGPCQLRLERETNQFGALVDSIIYQQLAYRAAQTIANVVTYVAVVGFSNVGDRLVPGMTANVRIVTDSRENVLKVPNAALRVRIAGVEPAAPAQGAASGASAPASTRTGSATGWTWLGQAMAQPAGGGGGLAALKERLVGELQLSVEQQTRFDAIAAELRPKFMALRDLPEDERGPAREKVSAEMRAKITAMLSPAQKARYEALQAQAGQGGGRTPPAAAASGPQDATKQVAAGGQSTPGIGPKDAKKAASAVPQGPASAAPSAPPAAAAPAAPAASLAAAPPVAPAPSEAGPAPGSGGGGGNAASEFRNRLVTELALTPSQIEKVDAIYADVRPKFATLRDLAPEERPKARERLMADIRARIGDLLTPEQKPRYAALVAQAASRQSTRGRIYLMGDDGKPVAVNVRLGITDGTSTELIVPPGSSEAGVLKEGAVVITGTVTPGGTGAQAARPATTGPRMPF